MIKCDEGDIELNGTKGDLMADLGCLIYVCRKKFGDDFVKQSLLLSNVSQTKFEEMEDYLNDVLEDLDKEIRQMALTGVLSKMPEEKLAELRKELKGD